MNVAITPSTTEDEVDDVNKLLEYVRVEILLLACVDELKDRFLLSWTDKSEVIFQYMHSILR